MQFLTNYGFGEVWIEMGGSALQEYGRQKSMEDLTITTSCFIEAQTGRTFRVHYRFPSAKSKPFPTEINLYIDGKLVDTDVSGCGAVQAEVKGTFQGYNDEDGKYSNTYKAFSFAEPDVSKEAFKEHDDPDDTCSIKVVIGWRRISGVVRHRPYQSVRYKEDRAKKIAEDSKKAVLGVHTVPGKTVQADSTYICDCKFIKTKNMAERVFLFKYRRYGWLVANKYIEPDSDDDSGDVEQGEHSNVSNAQKKARLSARAQRMVLPSEVEAQIEIKSEPLDETASTQSLPSQSQPRYRRQSFFIDLTEDD